MDKILFDLENVNVAYKDLLALHQINLQVTPGEKIALVGPSGAGKTTLLHKLYQLRPHECAFIHQHYALVEQLSAFHNVYMGRLDQHSTLFNLLNLIKPQKMMVKEILPILRSMGMEEKMFIKVGQLSGGQQQRIAVGRAIYKGSRILLADEPISSVDPQRADTILKKIVDTDKTVVMALHSVELTLNYARRIVGLCGGTIRFDLPTDQVTPDHITDLYISC